MHVVKVPIHPQGIEDVGGIPQPVELCDQVTEIRTLLKIHVRIRGETRDHSKRAKNIVAGFLYRTVASHMKEMTINNHHLAVKILKRPESKVTVLS